MIIALYFNFTAHSNATLPSQSIPRVVISLNLWGPPTAWGSLAFYGPPRRSAAAGINMENVLNVEHFWSLSLFS